MGWARVAALVAALAALLGAEAGWRQVPVAGGAAPSARYGHSTLLWRDTLVVFG
jgi:hypothetical protein